MYYVSRIWDFLRIFLVMTMGVICSIGSNLISGKCLMDKGYSSKGETIIGGKKFVWGARTYVMGVINVTPDSFSGDGIDRDLDAARRTAEVFERTGVDILDVGGESTRPPNLYEGSQPVSSDEELSRIIPVIEAITADRDVPVSIDTYKADVAREALRVGASMINDIWALQADSDMTEVVANSGVPVVLMHNQNNTNYRDLIPQVIDSLRRSVDQAVGSRVIPSNIILDPGIGFGKTAQHNLEIIRRLKDFDVLNRPVLVGTSRKSTIGLVLGLSVDDRVEGTAATVALSVSGGADIVRVHDVREMVRVVRMSDAIVRGWSSER